MPLLTRWFIKLSLVYLVAGLLVGLLLAARSVWSMSAAVGALAPIYFHLFMLGWVGQLIFGVVYWMFPKVSTEKPHGSEGLWWATFWLLNVGLLLRIVSEPAQVLGSEPVWGWLLALSALLQWLAGLVFVANTWSRVKER
jgi:cbb3-type cytochrome oxidase subunit 1